MGLVGWIQDCRHPVDAGLWGCCRQRREQEADVYARCWCTRWHERRCSRVHGLKLWHSCAMAQGRVLKPQPVLSSASDSHTYALHGSQRFRARSCIESLVDATHQLRLARSAHLQGLASLQAHALQGCADRPPQVATLLECHAQGLRMRPAQAVHCPTCA